MPSAAQAIGLGEPGQELVIGRRLDLSIPLLGAGKEIPDASCFRVVKPREGGDLSWVRQADLQVIPGSAPRLRVRSDVVREPLFQVAIDLGCGHDLYREYTLLANPALTEAPPPVPAQVAPEQMVPEPRRVGKKRERSEEGRAPAPPVQASVHPAGTQEMGGAGWRTGRLAVNQPGPETAGDRFFLSATDGESETSLRLSMALGEHMLRDSGFTEEQRETLRLEYRMLATLHERATDQLAMAEKMRNMEGALNDLQGKAASLQERAAAVDVDLSPAATPAPAVESARAEDTASNWGWYGLLLALILLLAGWFYWRQRQAQEEGRDDGLLHDEPRVDAPSQAELRVQPRSQVSHVDVHLEPMTAKPLSLDLDLDAVASPAPSAPAAPPAAAKPRPGDSIFSINATTVDEHFEANPVMELADIMLSFGRVKGAAQALQEYIDNNPQEALQPWVRLLEVYRMADMRDEFNAVANSLNQHFNVEIQPWETPAASPESAEGAEGAIETAQQIMARAQGVEDMPRIVAGLTKHWSSPEVLDYMQQLLRDNRAGQRQGFPLPVVEEILFLIELKETALNMESELAEA